MDFIQEYFCQPIVQSQGYNLVNTLVFAAIALCIAFFFIYPFFTRRGVKFDFKFGLSLLGYILLGSSARLIEDLRLVQRTCDPMQPGFWLVTPGIYIAVGLLAIFALAFSIWLGKKFKKDSIKAFGIIGAIACIPFLAFVFLNYAQLAGFGMILLFFAVFFAVVYFILKALKVKILEDSLNRLVFAGQLLDGTATFTAIGFFGYWEQHPLSASILDISPLLFPAVKIILVLAILYYVDREIKDKNLAGFVKILVMIFGFAPGFRGLLTIGFSAFGGF